MDCHKILSLLGLCLRGGHLVIGEEPVEGAARARDARILLLASDAADHTRRRCVHFSQAGSCLWLQIPCSKAELGQALGRSSVAIAAITDIGLANAVVRRLADADPAKYGEAAGKLELKAKRAAERKAEHLAHEKNLRQGKRKPPKTPSGDPAPSAPPKSSRPRRRPGKGTGASPSRPHKGADRFAHSRPVKKGKGSFRKKNG